MSSSANKTIQKMLESLPEAMQERVLEHMQEYIEDIRDEIKWSESFQRSRDNLTIAARHAREDIALGLSKPFDPDVL